MQYINQRRQTSLGLGMLTFSFTASRLLFRFNSSGNFSSLLFLEREEERFLSLITSEVFSQLLLGRRDLRSLPKLYRLGTLIVCSSLFSLFISDSQFDSLNFSPGNMYSRRRISALCSSPSALGRSRVLMVRHRRIKFSRSSEQNSGTRSKWPALIFFLRALMSLAMKGGLKAAISQRTQPSDQISHLPLQGRSDQTSGLAQQGVPVCVLAMPLLLILETLRSPSLISSWCWVSRTLALLMSRWKMFMRCRVFSPCNIWMANFQMSPSLMASFRFWWPLMKPLRSPPQANSVISSRQPALSSQMASLQPMMQGFVMLARIRTSFRQFEISRALELEIFIFFIAQISPSSLRFTLYTQAKAPSPTFARIQKLFIYRQLRNYILYTLTHIYPTLIGNLSISQQSQDYGLSVRIIPPRSLPDGGQDMQAGGVQGYPCVGVVGGVGGGCLYYSQIKNQMDNARQGRESLTKKISFHEKHSKNYRTIESLEKEPTKKKITLNEYHFKKESHPVIPHASLTKHQDRKIKSLSKYEVKKLSDSNKKRSVLGSEPELATIDGLLSRNMQMVKFSMSKERDRIITKQKYKRSEQVRSLLDNKKMSSSGKERRDTENSSRLLQGRDPEGVPASKAHFKEINLSTIINSNSGKEYEITLDDTFQEGVFLYYQYLAQKEEKLARVESLTTLHLKTIREELNAALEEANAKFKAIHQEVGEMSYRNLLMLAAVQFEQGRFNDVIMYIGRVLEKTEGNLFLIRLPGPDQKPNQSLTFLHSDSDDRRFYNLNLLSYLQLAESYKNTNNYLCSINIINKCEQHMRKILKKKSSLKHLKQHYQTLQPKESDEFSRPDLKPAIKKKSYMLSVLRPEPTANKFKKHSHNNSHNFSSIDLTKSKKQLEVTHRNEASIINQSEEDSGNARLASQKESIMVLEQEGQYEYKQYIKQLTSLFLLLARSYIRIKSYDMAIGGYKKCLQINPRKIQPLLELASLYHLKFSSKKCLEWLQICQETLMREECKDEKWQLDYSYILYHKSLILLQEGRGEESYQLFTSISAPELASEVNYYKAVIKLKAMNCEESTLPASQKNQKIESILMSLNQAITAFTSREYLVKSYFYILLILVFEKKDYYGAQYEVNRFKKLMPAREASKEEEKVGFSRISRIYEDDELFEKEQASSHQSGVWTKDSYYNLLFDIIDGIICILKMKIAKGIAIFKEVSLRVESNAEEIIKYYGHYYSEIIKLLFQFKFYGYYILREYELSLKHVNKLLEILEKERKERESAVEVRSVASIEIKLISINKLMLQCIILMKQTKFNYAMSKLTEIESLINQSGPIAESTHINSAFILNNFNMMKSLCYINLYCQLEREKQNDGFRDSSEETEDNNKEILLSAEELLRHCLISDKENSLIYYLISALYYELEQYQSSLKYIRQALEYSDDHMIKHYFCKANAKFRLARYDEAIKDYTNAIIVFKEQAKNETEVKEVVPSKKSVSKVAKEEAEEEYYSEKQVMFNEIYLNRAITYIKYAYQLTENKHYSQNSNMITSYKMKACEDLLKYFNSFAESRPTCSEKELRNHILLFLHTDDPGQLIEVHKSLAGKYNLVAEEDIIKVYYSIKELNNCILTLRNHISQMEHRIEEKQQLKLKKDSLPSKHKKISMTLPKKTTEPTVDALKLNQLKFDLRCLESLKKSSSKSQGALEQALIGLLEMTEEIYRKREEQLGGSNLEEHQNLTLENLFLSNCGEIFKWSDILFFIGVIHFELKEYETAIKYFEESENEKKANGTLHSLAKYLTQVLKRTNPNEEEEEYLFFELEAIFENRVYCKEELDYNIGICYLMLGKYKQAYYYLQNYPNFLVIIKKAITIEKELNSDNEFISKERPRQNYQEMLIDEPDEMSDVSPTKRYESKPTNPPKKGMQKPLNISNLSSLSQSFSANSNRESESDAFENITPFPTHNRLCSIYSPKVIEDKKFYLSFCLPKVDLPLLGLFHEQEVEPAERYSSDEQSQPSSDSSRMKELEEKPCKYPVERQAFDSVARHISLLDLEMKPIAPWIRQNTCGVIFTENLVSESVDLNSERVERRKEKEEGREQGKKGKRERYTDYEGKR